MEWKNCNHEWIEKYDSMSGRDVICIKCQCPGERDDTGGVYYPTT